MYNPKTFKRLILQVLETRDGNCLDVEAERRQVAAALFKTLDRYLTDCRL